MEKYIAIAGILAGVVYIVSSLAIIYLVKKQPGEWVTFIGAAFHKPKNEMLRINGLRMLGQFSMFCLLFSILVVSFLVRY